MTFTLLLSILLFLLTSSRGAFSQLVSRDTSDDLPPSQQPHASFQSYGNSKDVRSLLHDHQSATHQVDLGFCDSINGGIDDKKGQGFHCFEAEMDGFQHCYVNIGADGKKAWASYSSACVAIGGRPASTA